MSTIAKSLLVGLFVGPVVAATVYTIKADTGAKEYSALTEEQQLLYRIEAARNLGSACNRFEIMPKLRDPSSYEHVADLKPKSDEDDSYNKVIIGTTFRARNAFNGYVQGYCNKMAFWDATTARYDILDFASVGDKPL